MNNTDAPTTCVDCGKPDVILCPQCYQIRIDYINAAWAEVYKDHYFSKVVTNGKFKRK